MAAKIKKGDTVYVLTGKDAGRKGLVKMVSPSAGTAIVDNINVFIKHRKQTPNAEGGRIPIERPIQLSNLAIIDPQDKKPTRIGFRLDDDKKIRYSKRTGRVIDG